MSGLTTDKTHLPASSLSRVSPKTRIRAAENGEALPDGSFPIRDGADLKRAIQAYGRAKDKGAVKRHIIRRAKALDKTNLLPESWKEDAGKEFTSHRPSQSVKDTAQETGVSAVKLQAVYTRGLAASGSPAAAERRMHAFVELALNGPSNLTFLEDEDLLPKE